MMYIISQFLICNLRETYTEFFQWDMNVNVVNIKNFMSDNMCYKSVWLVQEQGLDIRHGSNYFVSLHVVKFNK